MSRAVVDLGARTSNVIAHAVARRTSGRSARVGRVESRRIRASLEGETNFVKINVDGDGAVGDVAPERFGPDATLVVGFTSKETAEWREVLDSIGASFVRVVTCDKALARGTLRAALETTQSDASAVRSALGVPRMMFLSGMNGAEVMEMIGVYEDVCEGDKGWAPCVFACAVPKNYDSDLSSLFAEIMDDHTRLTGGQKPSEVE